MKCLNIYYFLRFLATISCLVISVTSFIELLINRDNATKIAKVNGAELTFIWWLSLINICVGVCYLYASYKLIINLNLKSKEFDDNFPIYDMCHMLILFIVYTITVMFFLMALNSDPDIIKFPNSIYLWVCINTFIMILHIYYLCYYIYKNWVVNPHISEPHIGFTYSRF